MRRCFWLADVGNRRACFWQNFSDPALSQPGSRHPANRTESQFSVIFYYLKRKHASLRLLGAWVIFGTLGSMVLAQEQAPAASTDVSPTVDIPSDTVIDLEDEPPAPKPDGATDSTSIASSATALPVPENAYPVLRQLLDTALDQAPRMQAQRALDAAAEGNRITMRAGRLPSATASMQSQARLEQRLRTATVASSDKTNPNGPPGTKYNYWDENKTSKIGYSLGVSQPLYYWGVLRNNARIGRLQLQVSQQRTIEEYRNLVQDVRTQFLQAIIKRVTWERAVFARALEEKEARRLDAKLAANAASRAQTRRQALRVEQAQLAEDRAAEDYRRAKVTLAKLVGTDAVGDEAIPDVVEKFSLQLASLQSLTEAFVHDVPGRAANLSILRNQIEIENLNYRNAKARLRPKLDYIMGITRDEQNYGNTDYAPYGVMALYAGVSVSWPVFDGFASKGQAATALARRRELERVYRTTTADLADSARDRLKQVEFALRNMSISDRLLVSTERGLQRTMDNVKEGQASEADIDAARLNLYDSRIACYWARVDCLMKTTSFLAGVFEDPALANLDKKTP